MMISIALAGAGVFAAVAAILLMALALRAPGRPAVLASDAYDQAAAMILTTLFVLACGHSVTVLLDLRMATYTAAAVTFAFVVGSATVIWRLFFVRRRLRQADAGVSPFRLVAVTATAGAPGAPRMA